MLLFNVGMRTREARQNVAPYLSHLPWRSLDSSLAHSLGLHSAGQMHNELLAGNCAQEGADSQLV